MKKIILPFLLIQGIAYANPDVSKINIQVDPHSKLFDETQDINKVNITKENTKIILDKIADKAKAGDSESQVLIGLAYLNGKINDTPQYNIAMDWFQKASEKGNGDAMLQIGLMYMNASGRPQNIQEGMKWIAKGADAGSSMAKFTLATALRKESHYYYQQSAEMGMLSGQIFTALDYMMGNGVEQNLNQAYFWGQIALLNGAERLNPTFKEQINNVKSKIKESDLNNLDQKIQDYIANSKVVSSNIPTESIQSKN